ncbi:MAG TPA: alpha/beta hydrolase [Flavipsychrobacter sp.]|nr:alpha/beta hydrolase [Flavipsychrobacter sp.]
MSGYIELQNGKFHYLKMGDGKRLLLCFHGYANSASLFYPFQRYLEKDFTIISIDLPHHGKTEWKKTSLFQITDLEALVEKLLTQFSVQKVSLIGYSMGGRVCLKIIELMPEKIDRVLLIAADGLVFNPLYFIVTKTSFGKRLFRNFTTKPKRYLKYIEWMRSRKWIDESRYKFAMYYLGSESDRSFLLNVWSDMSLIVPNMKPLKAAIKKHQIPVYVFMGNYDRVIPVKNANRFKLGLNSVQLFVLEKGHRVFDSDSLPQMANCLIKGTC